MSTQIKNKSGNLCENALTVNLASQHQSRKLRLKFFFFFIQSFEEILKYSKMRVYADSIVLKKKKKRLSELYLRS